MYINLKNQMLGELIINNNNNNKIIKMAASIRNELKPDTIMFSHTV